MSVAEQSAKPPRRIGVYRIDEEIGSGAMGKVFRATHEKLGKAVALKLVHTDDPSGEVAARFLQEGIAASRIRHPNVVEILDAGEADGRAFMAMQLLEGETLAECLSRQGRLPQTYAVDLILPVCAALVAAHEAGVLHRDLKPSNIFLNEVGRGDPEPMLLDFGISKILGPVDPELTQNPRFLGSPLYIAPEQADGAAGSPRSDQYSLALTLYETLLGVRPFARFSSSLIQLLRHVAEGDIRKPRDLDASIPDELDQALCRALSTDPAKRFPSVRDFGAALLPLASEARRTLWQHAFVDAERTMTSANAPISDSKSSRRVQVMVEDTPDIATSRATETSTDPRLDSEEFLSHSSLFGPKQKQETETEAPFEPAQSSISRRARAFTGRPDPYSQVPSDRPSGDWNQGAVTSTGDRKTLDVSAPAAAPATSGQASSSRYFIIGLIVLASLITTALIIQPAPVDRSDTFEVTTVVTQEDATIELDGQKVAVGSFSRSFEKDGSTHRLRINLEGFEPQTLIFRDEAPPQTITLDPLPENDQRAKPISAASSDETEGNGAAAPDQSYESTPKPPPLPKKATITPVAPERQGTEAARPGPTQEEATPSDPERNPLGKESAANTEESPAKKEPKVKPSLHTGNLDPWAQ